MKTSKGGSNYGPLRTPMSADAVKSSPMVPKIARNTTMPGTAPKSAPISSPQAPFKGRK